MNFLVYSVGLLAAADYYINKWNFAARSLFNNFSDSDCYQYMARSVYYWSFREEFSAILSASAWFSNCESDMPFSGDERRVNNGEWITGLWEQRKKANGITEQWGQRNKRKSRQAKQIEMAFKIASLQDVSQTNPE